jgi:uncharacterized membrane protein (UPF0127 family)
MTMSFGLLRGLLFFIVLLVVAGCHERESAVTVSPQSTSTSTSAQSVVSPTNAVESTSQWVPTNAQPRLAAMDLFIGSQVVDAEVAITDPERAAGLMFRKSMGENQGMLFVFPVPHRAGFYMKNTEVPLTAAYIDSEGTILELHDLEPFNESTVLARSNKIQYVLEMNRGWFKKHGVKPGAVVGCNNGRLNEGFRFRRRQ